MPRPSPSLSPLAHLATLISRFRGSRQGSTSAMFSLSLVPVISLAGAAVDYSRASGERAAIQAAADAAAIAAVLAKVPTDQDRINVGRAVFRANVDPQLQATATVTVSGRTVTVTGTASVRTAFLHLVNVPNVAIGVTARAAPVKNGPPPCFLALNARDAGAVTITGGSVLVAEGCVVHSNSAAAGSTTGASLVIDSNTPPTAAGFCAVGRAYSAPGLNLRPAPEGSCDAMADPFADLPRPTPSLTCVSQNLVEPKDVVTLRPGTYCGGLTLKGTATLEPGVYIVKDGPLTITSQAKVAGTGVTFYITGRNNSAGVGFTINGQGGVDLKAPVSGVYGGILIFQDPLTAFWENTLAGGAESKIVGALYTPKQQVTITGGSGFGQSTPFMPVIADRIRVSGNTTARTDVTGINLAAPLPRSVSGALINQ